MTGLYDSNPMPHRLAVKCRRCGERAEFEFAELCRIQSKSDVEFFKNIAVLEYARFRDSSGHFWHAAIYFEGLHGSPEQALHALPAGYAPSAWSHSKYLHRSHGLDLGSVRCEHCHLRAKHTLRWPEEAYFSVAYKGNVLWAFDRESASELSDYLGATIRQRGKYRYASFLLHVPTIFKTHKAREVVGKQLDRLLRSDVAHGLRAPRQLRISSGGISPRRVRR